MYTLTALNAAMRSRPTGRLEISDWVDGSLSKALAGRLDREHIVGLEATIMLKTRRASNARPGGENIAIPSAGTPTLGQTKVPLFQLLANAQITMQAMDQATGMPASEVDALDSALDDLKSDWDWLSQIITIGDVSGRLARVVSVSNDGSTTTVTCDNTYTDFGWENVYLLKPGMQVEVYSAAGVQRTLNSLSTPAIVTDVSKGDRANGAATTGTFTYASAGTDSIADGDIVYLGGSHSSGINKSTYYAIGHTDNACMPCGLTGFIQDAGAAHLVDGATNYKLTTFQGVTRASYPTLYGKVVDGADINGGSADAPGNWDLSVVTDVAIDCHSTSGQWIDMLFASPRMAACIGRLQGDTVTIQTDSPQNAGKMAASGGVLARYFLMPGGNLIPIVMSEAIPDNCLYGVSSKSMFVYNPKDADFLRLYGDIWGPTKGDAYTNFEAPFGGYFNYGANRCDSMFVIKDLKTNV